MKQRMSDEGFCLVKKRNVGRQSSERSHLDFGWTIEKQIQTKIQKKKNEKLLDLLVFSVHLNHRNLYGNCISLCSVYC